MTRHRRLARYVASALVASALLVSGVTVASASPAALPPGSAIPVSAAETATATVAAGDLVRAALPLVPEELRGSAVPVAAFLDEATRSSDGYVGLLKLSLLLGFLGQVARMINRALMTVVRH